MVAIESVNNGYGLCGWSIDIWVAPLAETLREAMSVSDEERYAMGENGRRLLEAKYTWPAIAEQMKAAYTWMLNDREKPECANLCCELVKHG